MNRIVRDVYVAVSFGAALLGCGALRDGPAVGGETHFLVTCGEDCGAGLSCIGGACTRRCEPGFSSCSELAEDATCVSPAEGGEPELFGGTCDVVCTSDSDCGALGAGFSCRSGACRAEPESRQALLSTVATRAPLVRAVEAETCNTGLRWVGGDRPSAEMRPGSDCVGCHRETGARPLIIGGTVYPSHEFAPDDCYGIEGVEVIVVDARGRERSTRTNRAGNFYFEGRESDFAMPYSAELRYGTRDDPGLVRMVTVPRYGGCARCHGPGIAPASMLRLDPEEPEYVNGGFPVFVPGLLPQ